MCSDWEGNFFVESAAQVLVRIYHVMENAFVFDTKLVFSVDNMFCGKWYGFSVHLH